MDMPRLYRKDIFRSVPLVAGMVSVKQPLGFTESQKRRREGALRKFIFILYLNLTTLIIIYIYADLTKIEPLWWNWQTQGT